MYVYIICKERPKAQGMVNLPSGILFFVKKQQDSIELIYIYIQSIYHTTPSWVIIWIIEAVEATTTKVDVVKIREMIS